MSREKDENKTCVDFKSKYLSLKTVLNSLKTITTKCELFLQKINFNSNENEIKNYKKIITKLSVFDRSDEDLDSDDSSGSAEDLESNISSEDDFNDVSPKRLKHRQKTHVCQWPGCGMCFESNNAVQIHMRSHTGVKPFLCDWDGCGKSFRYENGLKLHKEMIHMKLKQFRCDWKSCEEAFVSLSQLNCHKTLHTGLKKYRCDWPECQWSTNWQQQVAIHRKRTHEGEKIKLKRYKSKTTSNPDSMYDINGDLKQFQCEWPGCDKWFKFEHNKETHSLTHEKSEKVIKKKTFSQRTSATKRKNGHKTQNERYIGITSRKKEFECEWPECLASYTTKFMLQQHENTHTGALPYSCSHCLNSYAFKQTLRSHILKNHSMNKSIIKPKFKCLFKGCDKTSDDIKGIVVHRKKVHNKND